MALELLSRNENDLRRHAAELQRYVLARIDLAGGWLPEIEASYSAKVVGYYRFDDSLQPKLREMADGLVDLYRSVGKQLQDRWGERRTDWPFDRFTSAQQMLLDRFVPLATDWASTLRADFVLKDGIAPKIVEVNSDNVAGLEDLIIYLGFYLHRGDIPEPHRQEMMCWLQRLKDAFSGMIDGRYATYFERLSARCQVGRPASAREAQIAVVYEDRYDSFFLARFSSTILESLGYKVVCCRPEHLHRSNGRLYVESVLDSMERRTVDVVIRHWLFFEMFDNDALNRLEPLFSATQAGEVITLNPFSERLLFSKALLAELTDPTLIELCAEHKRFVREFVTPTKRLSFSGVLKPSSEFGGRQVTMLDTASVWVTQDRLSCEIAHSVPYRTLLRQGDRIVERVESLDLYIVHGLLVYSGTGGTLGGVMTRVGPDPVVNFSRGAQIIPAIMRT